MSGDEVGINEVLSGADAHSLNQVAFNLPPGPPGRLLAKIFLFRTIFRGSGWAFANDPDFMHFSSSAKVWDGLNEKFYTKYKGLDKKHKEWAELVVSGCPITGPLGRSWFLEMKRNDHGEIKIPWTTLSNYPVQGTGADVMMIARISGYNRIKAANIDCKFVSTVHDSIVIDCRTEDLQHIVDIFHQVFDDLPENIRRLFKYEWVVPMTCEAAFGPNLKDKVKIARSS